MSILLYFFLTVHVIVSLLLVLVVLMQRPRSEGLGAAFGAGMTDNLFGAQTTHVLAKFTTWLGSLFFALTLVLAVLYSHLQSGSASKIQRELMAMPEPVAAKSETPTPTAKTAPDASNTQPKPVAPAAVEPSATAAPATESSATTTSSATVANTPAASAPASTPPAPQAPPVAPAPESAPAN